MVNTGGTHGLVISLKTSLEVENDPFEQQLPYVGEIGVDDGCQGDIHVGDGGQGSPGLDDTDRGDLFP